MIQFSVFFTVRFRTRSGFDAALDPIQMKNVTFDHVKGVEEAKNELQDVVEFLKNPQKFTVLGGKLPKGVETSLPRTALFRKNILKYSCDQSPAVCSFFSSQESSSWVLQEQEKLF